MDGAHKKFEDVIGLIGKIEFLRLIPSISPSRVMAFNSINPTNPPPRIEDIINDINYVSDNSYDQLFTTLRKNFIICLKDSEFLTDIVYYTISNKLTGSRKFGNIYIGVDHTSITTDSTKTRIKLGNINLCFLSMLLYVCQPFVYTVPLNYGLYGDVAVGLYEKFFDRVSSHVDKVISSLGELPIFIDTNEYDMINDISKYLNQEAKEVPIKTVIEHIKHCPQFIINKTNKKILESIKGKVCSFYNIEYRCNMSIREMQRLFSLLPLLKKFDIVGVKVSKKEREFDISRIRELLGYDFTKESILKMTGAINATLNHNKSIYSREPISVNEHIPKLIRIDELFKNKRINYTINDFIAIIGTYSCYGEG